MKIDNILKYTLAIIGGLSCNAMVYAESESSHQHSKTHHAESHHSSPKSSEHSAKKTEHKNQKDHTKSDQSSAKSSHKHSESSATHEHNKTEKSEHHSHKKEIKDIKETKKDSSDSKEQHHKHSVEPKKEEEHNHNKTETHDKVEVKSRPKQIPVVKKITRSHHRSRHRRYQWHRQKRRWVEVVEAEPENSSSASNTESDAAKPNPLPESTANNLAPNINHNSVELSKPAPLVVLPEVVKLPETKPVEIKVPAEVKLNEIQQPELKPVEAKIEVKESKKPLTEPAPLNPIEPKIEPKPEPKSVIEVAPIVLPKPITEPKPLTVQPIEIERIVEQPSKKSISEPQHKPVVEDKIPAKIDLEDVKMIEPKKMPIDEPSSEMPANQVLSTIAVDWNSDHFIDSAVLLKSGNQADLYLYFANIKGDLDLKLHKKGLVWAGILPGTQPSLTVKTNEKTPVLTVNAENSSVGQHRWSQRISIEYRRPDFFVTAYAYNDLEAGDEGSCDVNLLTGQGFKDKKPFHIEPRKIKLSAWSEDYIPSECRRDNFSH